MFSCTLFQVWDLSGSEVEVLESGSFRDSGHLRELRLSRVRRLRMVDSAAFVNLTSLRRLELSLNRHLRYVSRSAFVDVPALTGLDLSLSALSTLESEVLDSQAAQMVESQHQTGIETKILVFMFSASRVWFRFPSRSRVEMFGLGLKTGILASTLIRRPRFRSQLV